MQAFSDRGELFDFLINYAQERVGEIGERRAVAPLIKTYMLEVIGAAPPDSLPPDVLFCGPYGFDRLHLIETGLYAAESEGMTGFVERVDDQYWVLYTTERTGVSDPFIHRLTSESSHLDHVWLSAPLLQGFWEHWIVPQHEDHRFVRIHFSFVDEFAGALEEPNGEEHEEGAMERKISKITLMEQKQTLARILPELQDLLPSFKVVDALRFPAVDGSGGHDVYFNGKVTNRSSDFLDHREQILTIIAVYRAVNDQMLQLAHSGSPIVMKFARPLSAQRWENFVEVTFERGAGRYQLSGNPLPSTDGHRHVYGVDMRAWQEICLDLSDEQVVLSLPPTTSASVFHRLLTLTQQHLEPDTAAVVGETPFSILVRKAIEEKGAVSRVR